MEAGQRPCGSGHAGARTATAAAFSLASAPALNTLNPSLTGKGFGGLLALPGLSPEIPAGLTVTRNTIHHADLAAALLYEGLIQESDWNGDIAASVHQGLLRLLSDDAPHGFGGWHGGGFVPLTLSYTDDVRHVGLGSYDSACDDDDYDEDEFDYGGDPLKGEPPGGGFGLVISEWREAYVGKVLGEIEAAFPGAGYSVLAALEDALNSTAGCIGPSNAFFMIKTWDAGSDQKETNQETRERFRRHVPAGTYEAQVDAQAIFTALASEALPAQTREILTLAAKLSALTAEAFSDPGFRRHMTDEDNMYGYMLDSIVPTCLRWQEGDMIRRIFDDYHEDLNNHDGHTRVAWFQSFQMTDALSIRSAAQQTRRALGMIVTADRLLALCHTPVDAPLAAGDLLATGRQNHSW